VTRGEGQVTQQEKENNENEKEKVVDTLCRHLV
jgi:hypothetical protein